MSTGLLNPSVRDSRLCYPPGRRFGNVHELLLRNIEAKIRERVASGRYSDVNAVVGEAMPLLVEHERLERQRALGAARRQDELRGDLAEFAPDVDGGSQAQECGGWMSVMLTPELQAKIQERVDSGRYGDATEVIGDALQLLEERERLEHLRALLEVGRQDELRGDLVKFTPELFEDIDRRVEEMLLRGDEPDPDVCP